MSSTSGTALPPLPGLSANVDELPPLPAERRSEWIERMSGRRLKATCMNKSRMSVPEWMGHDAHQKGSSRSSRSKVLHHLGKRSSQAEIVLPPLQPVVPGSSSSSPPPVGDTSKKRTTYVKHKPISFELARKNRMHPRLRWPTLAKRVEQSRNSNVGIIEEAIENGANMASEEDGDLAASVKEYLNDDDMAPDVIGPGSLFYTGKLVATEPEWTKQDLGDDQDGTRSETFSELGTLGHGGGALTRNVGSLEPKSASPSYERGEKQTLLCHAAPYLEPHGHSATVHLPRLPGSSIDHRAQAKKGGKSHADRKYLLRQAPASQIMCRDTALASQIMCRDSSASENSSNSRSIPEGQALRPNNTRDLGSKGFPTAEYLDFESWGIDDCYVELHCKKAHLEKIRFMKLSNNRLTDQSLNAMLQVGQAPWALESLQIGSCRLHERGGQALARLLDGVRPPLRELDLSDNLIGDKACEALCEVISGTCCLHLSGLTLAHNELGHNEKIGTSLAHVVSSALQLEVLDLNWNFLHGLGAVAFFNGLYENNCVMNGKLRRLNVAWNRLGLRCSDSAPKHAVGSRGSEATVSSCTCSKCNATTRAVKMLASVMNDGEMLFHLDLSYNGINGSDCAVLAEGLKNNHTLFGLHLMGNSACVDELGFVVPSLPGAEQLSEEKNDKMNRYFENIPSMMRLDLAPKAVANKGLSMAAAAAPTSPRLATSSTYTQLPQTTPAPDLGLFGGNLVNPSLRSIGNASRAGRHPPAFSTEDLQVEKDWVSGRSKAQQALDFGTICSFEDVRRNARCCWICENWVEQRVSYIPGWSGPEVSHDEVFTVFAYFSIDGFVHATKLIRVEEPLVRRTFDAERAGNLRQLGRSNKGDSPVNQSTPLALGRRPFPALTDQGRVVRWTGCRMLPPTMVPIQVIFQVNDRLTTADDMPRKDLAVPKAVKLHDVGRVATARSRTQSGDDGDAAAHVADAMSVNTVSVGITAWEKFELGEATALVVLEDPSRRGQIKVLPRNLQDAAAPRPQSPWSFEKSVFGAYGTDDNLGDKLFEHDWKLCKLDSLVRDPLIKEPLRDMLRKHHLELTMAHHHYSFVGFRGMHFAAGLLLLSFTQVLQEYGDIGTIMADGGVGKLSIAGQLRFRTKGQDDGDNSSSSSKQSKAESGQPQTKSSALFNSQFRTGNADTIFVGTSVLDKDRRKGMNAMPDKGLNRFQFLEAFVRVATQRYQEGGQCDNACESTNALWEQTKMGQDLWEKRQALHKDLFCEECDMVYKEYYHMLEAVYVFYKEMHIYPGRLGNGLSFGAWSQLLQDADVPMPCIGAAFALAKELRVDEYLVMRHMELSWSEFLVCLAAVVALQPDFERDFFADLLADFFADHVSKARQGRLDGPSSQAVQDAGTTSVLAFVRRLWADADDDGSGILTWREFRRAVNQSKVQQEMREMGIPPEELNTLFSNIDQDGSGDITLDELCAGFMKMKQAMRGSERAVAYFRKAFEEADVDKSGTLSMPEFKALTTNPRVTKRLAALGVCLGTVETLFENLQMRTGGRSNGYLVEQSITADDMIAGFLAVRETGLGESRGVNFLRHIFTEADTDGSQALSRPEMQKSFCTEKVTKKLQELGLTEPDWMGVFDVLDLDGNGDISWKELSEGVCQMWKKEPIDEQETVEQAEASPESSQQASRDQNPKLQQARSALKLGGATGMRGSLSSVAFEEHLQ